MKDKLLIAAIILLLAISVTLIFSYGEYLKKQKDYTLVYFNSLDKILSLDIKRWECMVVDISNYEDQTNTYTITYYINNQKIDVAEEVLKPGATRVKYIPDDFAEWLKKNIQEGTIDFKVVVEWDGKNEELHRKIFVDNTHVPTPINP